ncbi:hypothetical protein M0G74_03025 [Microbulbifer sp. CAU 1566]|uniref:hypothetical protein n=1 Tax=unclassified Microbulbifer TaxID=2619833 RepID=UPI00135BF47B|nr:MULTISPECIES: hypothetical protein [unclassified Microbulbifer]MCK7596238.1 hypothetical protein [Microbulbifer sp. CAU 1566]
MAVAAESGNIAGWPLFADGVPAIHLAVAPMEVTVEAPTPLTGNNLQLLLALSGSNGGLGEMKNKAMQEFAQHLEQQVQQRFGEFFVDEKVKLVTQGAPLSLHTKFTVVIRQRMNDIFNGADYDLEKGTMNAYGNFRYQLLGFDRTGKEVPLKQGRVDIADLRLKADYRTRAPKDGGVVEDTTRQATERLLEEIAEEVLDKVEDDLEAGSLLKLARL